MIPKIIHYCWFGEKEKPSYIKKYMRTWKKLRREYKFYEWNEKNCDLQCNEYVKSAVKVKNWAFVSDYFRLLALYNSGGYTLIQILKYIKILKIC